MLIFVHQDVRTTWMYRLEHFTNHTLAFPVPNYSSPWNRLDFLVNCAAAKRPFSKPPATPAPRAGTAHGLSFWWLTWIIPKNSHSPQKKKRNGRPGATYPYLSHDQPGSTAWKAPKARQHLQFWKLSNLCGSEGSGNPVCWKSGNPSVESSCSVCK